MNTAILVRRLDWDTDTALYRLDPPVSVSGDLVEHVVVSTIRPVDGHHGTLVFAATPHGEVDQWAGIARSDHADHQSALGLLRYQVAS